MMKGGRNAGLLCLAILAAGWMDLAGQETAPAPAVTTTQPSFPTEAELRETVGRLGHPLHAIRQTATRRLAEWGLPAVPALREVAESADLEAALSARKLLVEMQAMLFLNAEVRLSVDRQTVAWNEPFDLIVRVHNPSPAPVRLPWPPPRRSLTTQPASADAAQVASMLDVADFLTVLSHEATPLELRLDPIDADSEIRTAVELRAGLQPPSQWIEPGRTAELRVPEFNRGWARYPMFEAGEYQITLRYQPPWEDESWIEDELGVVASNTVTVRVTNDAPAAVREAERPLRLALHQEGEFLRADLTNLWDRPVTVNLNLGPEPGQYAQLAWEFHVPDADEPFAWQVEPDAPGFDSDRLRHLQPMETTTIIRIPTSTLRMRATAAGVAPQAACTCMLRYFHLATAEEVRARLRPRMPDVSVPLSLFSGLVVSEPIPLEASIPHR